MKSIQKPTPDPASKVFASAESIAALRASIDAAGLTVKAAARVAGVSAAKFEQKLRGYSPARSDEVGAWIAKIVMTSKIV